MNNLALDCIPAYSSLTNTNSISGARIAYRDLCKAILQWSSFDHYSVLTTPGEEQTLRKQLMFGEKRVSIHNDLELTRNEGKLPITLWYSPGGEVWRPFLYRAHLNRIGSNFPVTITIHSAACPAHELHYWFLPFLVGDVRPYDAILCTSEAAKRAIERVIHFLTEDFSRQFGTFSFPGKIEVACPGVDVDFFQPQDKVEARKRFQLPPDAFIILWFGRVSITEKGDLHPLLKALQIVRRTAGSLDFHLVVAGPSKWIEYELLQEWSEQLGLADIVHWLGPVSLEDRDLLYGSADVFVSPGDSVEETFGLTLLEAMASGIPQIVSDWDGYRELVRPGETGFLVPTHWLGCDEEANLLSGWTENFLDLGEVAQSVVVDVEALAHAILILLENPSLRKQMAEKSRERAIRYFAWPQSVARFQEIWNELITEASHRQTPIPPHWLLRLPDYKQAFGTYPTKRLDDHCRIRLSAEGRSILKGGCGLPTYYESISIQTSDLHIETLLVVRELTGSSRNAAVSVRDVIDEVQTFAPQCSRALLRQHVAWLVKYGFCKLVK